MDTRRQQIVNILSVLVGLIPVVIQYSRGGDPTSLALFGIVVVLISIIFIWDWVNERIGRIDSLVTETDELKKRFDSMERITELDKRLSILEHSRKGAVDPKIVMFIMLVIVVLLYLRQVGII